MSNIRNFKVQGNIACLFKPETGTQTKLIPNIEVELWQKAPLETLLLGKGLTDELGNFIVAFEVNSPSESIVNGKINNVFLKAYYRGQLITPSRSNPTSISNSGGTGNTSNQ
jgi:hypothetical protein